MAKRKFRIRQSRDMGCIHEGIVSAIQESQGSDERPAPAAYFVSLMALLENPDPSMLPQLLTLLDQTMKQMNPTTVKYAEAKNNRISSMLCNVIRKHSDNINAGKKAFNCVRTLYAIVDMNDAALQNLQLFEPSKHNADLMVAYNNLMQVMLVSLHFSNPALCRARLPILMERMVQQFMNDTREDVATNASDSLRKILGVCMDEEMLQEDRDCPENLKSTGSCLAKLLGLLQPLIQNPHFQNNWDLVASVFGVVFRRMGRDAFPRLNNVLTQLDQIRLGDDFHYRVATERALGRALRAIGARNFFTLIPFDPLDLDEKRTYLFRIIKKYVSHDSLQYFNNVVMAQAQRAHQIAEREASTKNDSVAKLYELTADRLWHLAPSFCKYPTDFAQGYVTFAKAVVEMWKGDSTTIKSSSCNAMRQLVDKMLWLSEAQPKPDEEEMGDGADSDAEGAADFRSVTTATTRRTAKSIRSSGTFASIFGDDRGTGDDIDDDDKEREEEDPHKFHGISKDEAQANVAILKKYSRVVLPKLCNLFEASSQDQGRFILETIHSYAKVSEESVLNTCFTTLTKKILDSPSEDMDEDAVVKMRQTRHVMLDIASGILAALDLKHLRILYDLLPPLLMEDKDRTLQKKGYRILSKLHDACKDFMLENTQNSFAVCAEAQMKCMTGSRVYRLQALVKMFTLLNEANPQMVPAAASQFLHEIVLSIREPGTRVHETAFYLIRLLCNQMLALHGNCNDYFKLLLDGCKSKSAALVQCSIIALANVLVEHYNEVSDVVMQTAITTVVGLLAQDDTQVRNATFGFCKLVLKVVVYHPPAKAAFEACLPTFMEGVVFWLNHEKAASIQLKARVLVERAIKRFGYEAIAELTPENKKKFVKYVEKQRSLEQRRKEKEKDRERMSSAEWVSKFKEEFFDKEKKKKKDKNPKADDTNGRKFLMQASSTEPEDLMDPSIVKNFYIRPADKSGAGQSLFDGPEDNFQMSLDPMGKIHIADKDAPMEQMPGGESIIHLNAQKHLAGKASNKRKRGRDDDDDDADDDVNQRVKPDPAGPKAANQGFAGLPGAKVHKAPITQKLFDLKKGAKKRKLNQMAVSGDSYRSRRGAGDVKKEGMADPYAYIPLSAGFLNKRNKRDAAKRFDSVTDQVPKVHQQLPRSKRLAMAQHATKKGGKRRNL